MRTRYMSRRNPLPLPPIQHEELFYMPVTWKHCQPGWEDTVCTSCRLNMHHTLTSIRKDCHLKGPLKPQHSLDLSLSALYQHGPEHFPDKTDTIRQPETAGYPTWRLLKNNRYDPNVSPVNTWGFAMSARSSPFQFGETREERRARLAVKKSGGRRSVDPTHPLRLGGLTERRHPHNVKLGISSNHSPQTNNGFSRNSYGAFFTS